MRPNDSVIYLADDDEDDRMFMRAAIKHSGWQATIVETENGHELLRLLKQQTVSGHIKLIILDMNMPMMNGLDVLQVIRADHLLCHVPAIIFSTSDEPELVRQAYRTGVNAYIKKPSDYAALDTISEAIKICFLNT